MVFLRPAVLSCFMSVIFFTAISATPNEGDIRLSGSADKWQGRVEIFHKKTWGTICDDYWDINYAKVVCRQLGFEDALEVYASADFGQGSGPIHLDRLRCSGNESRLIDCDTRGWNHGYCDHSEDVGVACLHTSDIPPGGCTFDVDWCGYTNANDDDFDWLRQSKRTPSYNTGPAHDHTTGNGSYIYIETSSPRVQGEMARVVSPPFTGAKCIQFYYIMKGRTVNELNVYIDNGLARKMAWQSKGENRTWNKGLFPVTQSGSVKIIFEGLVGVNYQGDIAIDDVTPLKTSCSITPKDAKPEPIDLSNITSIATTTGTPVSKPTGTPGHKDCRNCPGTCYRTIKHSGFCICSTSGGHVADSKCDATEGIEVSDVAFAKLTIDKWNSDHFKTNLMNELNSYCSTDKTCQKIVNGSKFEIQDIIVLDNWPTTFIGKLNLKFIVLVPIQNSRNVLPRDVITTMSQKQKNKLAGYEVVVTRKPVMPPAAQTSKNKNSKTIDIVVPIVVILAIVGVAVVAYVIYKKRSAFGSRNPIAMSQYTHLSSSDDDDDPLLSLEDDHDHDFSTPIWTLFQRPGDRDRLYVM